jgi:hypothetical protein
MRAIEAPGVPTFRAQANMKAARQNRLAQDCRGYGVPDIDKSGALAMLCGMRNQKGAST